MQALQTVGHAPDLVTTDGHGSYPRAIRETFGGDVLHQANHSLNNLVEQDHRGIRTALVSHEWVWKLPSGITRVLEPFTRVRHFFRFRSTIGQYVSLVRAS